MLYDSMLPNILTFDDFIKGVTCYHIIYIFDHNSVTLNKLGGVDI